VEVLAHGRCLGHGGDGLGPQVLRVGAGVADPAHALDVADGAQQVGEEGPDPHVVAPAPGGQREVTPVGVDVLTEQRHLHHPVGHELAGFGDEVVERPADLRPADRRHDAEGAGVVAPDLDGEPRRVPVLPPHRESGGERLGIGRGGGLEDLGDRAVLAGVVQELDRPVDVVGAEHHVHVGRPLPDAVTVLLGEAPADHDPEIGPGRLDRLQVAQRAVELVVGVLTDAAGVEHDHVGIVHTVRSHHAVGLVEPRDALGVVLVHLASERPDGIAQRLLVRRHAWTR
jgi:hypothetical protein